MAMPPPGVVSIIRGFVDAWSTSFAFRMARFPTMFMYALTFSLMANLAIYLGKTFFVVILPLSSFGFTHVVYVVAVIFYLALLALFLIGSPLLVFFLETTFSGNIHYLSDQEKIAELEKHVEDLGEEGDGEQFHSIGYTRAKIGAVVASPIFVLFYNMHEEDLLSLLARTPFVTWLFSSVSGAHLKGHVQVASPNVVHPADIWSNTFMRDMQAPILIMSFFCVFYFMSFVFEKMRTLGDGKGG